MKKAKGTKTVDKPRSNKKVPATRKSVAGKKKPTVNKKPVSNKKPETGKKPYQKLKMIVLLPVRIKKHGDSNNGHHHVILEDFENKHVSVGLTTEKMKGRNSTNKNYRCEVDPLGGKKQSYMRRQGTVAPKTEYEPTERKGHMSKKDLEKAKIYGEKAKQKYLEKMQQKKQ